MFQIALLAAVIAQPAVEAQPIPTAEPAAAIAPAAPLPPPQPPTTMAPPPTQVGVTQLAAPDAFSTAARDTGLPADLWRGASVKTARAVLPLVATKPLSPAAQALARRVLATGAAGPDGAGLDPELSAGRAAALTALGDLKAATTILARTAAIDRSPALSRAAADAALLAGDDVRACAVEDALASGREDVYWLRLRAFCQAVSGRADQAQLTFDLAQGQARDAIFGRLMAAKLTGSGDPGAASLRNALDYALSRNLGLDMTAVAKPSPAVVSALTGGEPPPALVNETVSLGDPAILAVAGEEADAKARPRAQAVALLAAALAEPLNPDLRARLAAFTVPEGKAPAGRNLALEDAAQARLMGETALLALWTAAEAGPTGLALGDRVRIVRALRLVGLQADARAFAQEGASAAK